MTLLETAAQFLGVVCGMFVVLGLWYLQQALIRRWSGCRNPDKDVLDVLLNGCGGGCRGGSHCGSKKSGEIEIAGIGGAR